MHRDRCGYLPHLRDDKLRLISISDIYKRCKHVTYQNDRLEIDSIESGPMVDSPHAVSVIANDLARTYEIWHAHYRPC